MARNLQTIRNIGIIAHIDAGKTTLTEHMLFYSGEKHRLGAVDKGTTETDCDPEEQERGITIYSAAVTFEWLDFHINLIDTPGHVDFTAEVERCLRVLDGAVVVFSAREGVEAQSETVWRQANKYKVPRICFINKMDREGANYQNVFDEIAGRLHANPVAIQIPVGQGPAHFSDPFRGVVDLIGMKMRCFDPATDGKEVRIEEIPEALLDDATMWRETMLEKLYSVDETLMDLALAELPLSENDIRGALRRATIKMAIQPVLCGSALHGIGVQPVLDGVVHYLPNPADIPPVVGKSVGRKGVETTATRAPSDDEPFSGLIFKVLPAKTGDLSWLRVYSGTLKSNSRALNPANDKKENIAQMWLIHATRKEVQVDEVHAGDIVGIIGLRNTITGDTLCDARDPIQLETIQFPETVMSMAIEPESAVERKKLQDTLELLKRQDPTLRVSGEETGQTLISGMGELHLEIIKNRLLRDFNLNVRFHKPQVSYRETIGRRVEVTGECHRMISGQQLFARISMTLEPYEGEGTPVVVLNRVPPDTIPEPLLNAAIEEVRARAQGGGLISGFPLIKLRVTVTGGECTEQTDERAVRIAVNEAFNTGLEQGGKVLLEPIMKLDITTPEEYVGDFIGDLQQRRAVIAHTENRGVSSFIEAHAPLRELFGYSSAMRSLSQGRAGCSVEPHAYAPAPDEIAKSYEMD